MSNDIVVPNGRASGKRANNSLFQIDQKHRQSKTALHLHEADDHLRKLY
jgi:hypothetical protein